MAQGRKKQKVQEITERIGETQKSIKFQCFSKDGERGRGPKQVVAFIMEEEKQASPPVQIAEDMHTWQAQRHAKRR